jgi:Lon protease-like protein
VVVAEEVAAIDPAQAEAVCARLAQLLAEDDAESTELLQTHAALLRQVLQGRYPAIEAAVAQFDFEAALALLQQRH